MIAGHGEACSRSRYDVWSGSPEHHRVHGYACRHVIDAYCCNTVFNIAGSDCILLYGILFVIQSDVVLLGIWKIWSGVLSHDRSIINVGTYLLAQ